MAAPSENQSSNENLDPLKMSEAFLKMGRRVQNLLQNQKNFQQNDFLAHVHHVTQFYSEAASKLMYNPEKVAAATQEYLKNIGELGQQMMNFAAQESVRLDPIITPARNDRRFKSDLWQKNPFFDTLKQSYLLWNQWICKTADAVEGLDKTEGLKFNFYTRQIADFFSPSNFLWTNPQALQKIIDSKGMSFLKGMENFVQDLEEGDGNFSLKMVDTKAFELGKNLATTPGKIVFQNDLIQLIQYQPLTNQVYQQPLLLIPPCINKYYIFDMRPDNSFTRWCLEQGMQVFIISWVNPDEKLATKSFEDYVFEGVGEAARMVQEITQSPLINALGFCIGGTFLSAYAAYTSAKGQKVFSSLTYLATLFDFGQAGDLKVFIDEEQLNDIEQRIQEKGLMEGRILARTFNLLRANDLIWWFVVNNYLLGEEPAAFDLLYWNSDFTDLPAKMYIYYLREIFFKNRLMKAQSISLKDQPLDLSKIDIPSYIFSTRDDHIAPWQAGYAGVHILASKTKFVLGDSGHIAGVFNPPQARKYQYWTSDQYPQESEQWLLQAQNHQGSWWQDWCQWINPFLGTQRAADSIEDSKLDALEMAPGSYALRKGAA
ncbi:MAG: PHA/PHB synthase family protein [Janthinobacterium lividum]